MTNDVLPILGVSTADVAHRPWESFGGMSHVHIKRFFEEPHTVAGLMRLDAGAVEGSHVHLNGQHHGWVVEGAVEVNQHLFAHGSYFHVPHGVTHQLRADPEIGATIFFVYVTEA